MKNTTETKNTSETKEVKKEVNVTTKLIKTITASWLIAEGVMDWDTDLTIKVNHLFEQYYQKFGIYESEQLVRELATEYGVEAFLLMDKKHENNVEEKLDFKSDEMFWILNSSEHNSPSKLESFIDDMEMGERFAGTFGKTVFIMDKNIINRMSLVSEDDLDPTIKKLKNLLNNCKEALVVQIDFSADWWYKGPASERHKYDSGDWKNIARLNFDDIAKTKDVIKSNKWFIETMFENPEFFNDCFKERYDALIREFQVDYELEENPSTYFSSNVISKLNKNQERTLYLDKGNIFTDETDNKELPLTKRETMIKDIELNKILDHEREGVSGRGIHSRTWPREKRISESQEHFNKVCKDTSFVDIYDGLSESIVGQERAVLQVSDIIETAISPINSKLKLKSNLGSAFFAGPSGTGKTQMAFEISKYLFGTDETVIKFNMATFSHPSDISTLKGSPTGYLSSDYTPAWMEKLNKEPNRVIVFDEVEKAHPKVLDILLGILVDKEFSASNDKTSDLSKTFIILTSNVGQNEFDHKGVAQTIHNFFAQINRTEILGRIGNANLVSFNRFIGEDKMTLFMNKYKLFVKEIKDKTGYIIKIPKKDVEKLGQNIIDSINWKLGARDLQSKVNTKLLEGIESLVNLRRYVKLENDDKIVKLKFRDGKLVVNDMRGMN